MLHIEDSIIRELILPASPQEVWTRSFGSPEALASWFPERVECVFEVGAIGYLVWGEHRSQIRIVEYVPGSMIAYQWHPGDAFDIDSHPESELTTVRFTLEPHPEGTKVTMVESGFHAIAESRRAWAFGQNDGGWDEELPKLSKSYEG